MRATLASLLTLALIGSGHGAEHGSARVPFQARFAVRGRWPGEREIRYRLEPEGGPLSSAEFRAAIESAAAKWSASGYATFRSANADEAPDVTLAWRRGAHESCTPFGIDSSVAHSGPVARGTFVHFDADREWDAAGLSLEQAALHELGHVLGLDHCPDETAVMYAEPGRARDQLGRSDLAGLRALYGSGGRTGHGDLVVRRADRSVALVLSSVAPSELTDWALFDADGDGADELLVWRTDAAGAGALWEYSFARGPLLARTLGPFYGIGASGARLSFRVMEDGRRLAILEARDGRVARRFDANGLPVSAEDPPPMMEPASHSNERRGDLDGNGTLESVTLSD